MMEPIFCLDVAKSHPNSLKYFRDEKFAFQVNQVTPSTNYLEEKCLQKVYASDKVLNPFRV